jgi:hypothetical protein
LQIRRRSRLDPQPLPPGTITSTAATLSSRTARSLWPSDVSWPPEAAIRPHRRRPVRIRPTAPDGDMSRAFVSSAMQALAVAPLGLRSVGCRGTDRRDGARRGGGARGLQTRQAPLGWRFAPLASHRGAPPQDRACARPRRAARWRGAAIGGAAEAKARRSCPKQAQVRPASVATRSAHPRRRSRRPPRSP